MKMQLNSWFSKFNQNPFARLDIKESKRHLSDGVISTKYRFYVHVGVFILVDYT